ncbi:hypothetical protein MA20_01360 [Bradyrhizobium japonicum]|uniref:Uncharacterized protein n=1 Tax=Bradyrhizobium japonicum TaxID=375 RepID=A0A0A3Y3X6_BRAJP|nr:hypothetical protein MA20_01360 [Bradyrhizobium japonicum]
MAGSPIFRTAVGARARLPAMTEEVAATAIQGLATASRWGVGFPATVRGTPATAVPAAIAVAVAGIAAVAAMVVEAVAVTRSAKILIQRNALF